ncbi:MAG TPA: DUF2252 family protein [Verrucomicrobiae bacterium]|jgi:hypothetical protein|nr:DUF2252 family protein [Verrucomicrobiae bacterium]
MDIIAATKSYEAWLSKLTPLIRQDIKLKHSQMREDVFCFLRATYYRWAQIFPEACPALANDPQPLAVGDLHVENFGTWRDSDGRLVWGVNDFDECARLPFGHDLVRLAVSAFLAIDDGDLGLTKGAAVTAILEGYNGSLKISGKPFVLVDRSSALRTMARERLNNPERFWAKMVSHPPVRQTVPASALRAIRELLPERNLPLKFLHRIAGLGSLGKQRFTGVGNWRGGPIVREAKALTVSACHWTHGGKGNGPIHYEEILRRAVRCPDPMVRVRGTWLVRRLSPDCFRIRLSNLPQKRDERELLYSMGWETANIHLGTVKPNILLDNLKRKSRTWLLENAVTMHDQTKKDWKAWRK